MKQSPEEKAAAAVAELRAVIREAHETAQELRAVMKQARAQVEGYVHSEVQAGVDAYTRQMQAAVDEWNRDAKAHAVQVMKSLEAAMASICTIVVDGLKDPGVDSSLRADIVIDLRGPSPVMADAGSERGRAILADAPYQVIMGPEAGRFWPGAGPGGASS